ncbi:hypothetical protein CLOM_g12678 [Closterium sp. NIES-68]|nr:hypothetical protein CLOM_g12678 [Closterium sp. NIES-68]GJP82780.1 hypothetical protein CLOP_g13014 [Closterium sp. NIES-67]
MFGAFRKAPRGQGGREARRVERVRQDSWEGGSGDRGEEERRESREEERRESREEERRESRHAVHIGIFLLSPLMIICLPAFSPSPPVCTFAFKLVEWLGVKPAPAQKPASSCLH